MKNSSCQWIKFSAPITPIRLDEDNILAIEKSERWLEWGIAYNREEIAALRRFFIGSLSNIFAPFPKSETNKRYTLQFSEQQRPHYSIPESRESVTVNGVELIIFDSYSFLIFEITGPAQLSENEMLTVNEEVFSWHPRYAGHEIAFWAIRDEKKSLKSWVSEDLFSASVLDEQDFEDVADWFGHSIPSFSLIVEQEQNHRQEARDLLIHLLTGTKASKAPQNMLAENEKDRLLNNNILQVWNNWLLAQNDIRVVAVYSSQSSAQVANAEKLYVPVATLVFYQKLMSTYLLQSYMRYSGVVDSKSSLKIRKQLLDFRRKYNVLKVSTFPLGEQLYQFLRKGAGIDSSLTKLTQEIETTDEFEHILIERKESKTINVLTWFATLAIPIATASGVFALDQEQLTTASPFWISSILATFCFVLLAIYIRRKKVD